MNEYLSIIEKALDELQEATGLMSAKTFPRTPLPRPRRFVIIDGHIEWPYPRGDWQSLLLRGRLIDRASLTGYRTADIIMAACPTPRHVLHALQRIRAATAWCRARREGRLRAAQNIMRQQERAVEALDAEVMLSVLSR